MVSSRLSTKMWLKWKIFSYVIQTERYKEAIFKKNEILLNCTYHGALTSKNNHFFSIPTQRLQFVTFSLIRYFLAGSYRDLRRVPLQITSRFPSSCFPTITGLKFSIKGLSDTSLKLEENHLRNYES